MGRKWQRVFRLLREIWNIRIIDVRALEEHLFSLLFVSRTVEAFAVAVLKCVMALTLIAPGAVSVLADGKGAHLHVVITRSGSGRSVDEMLASCVEIVDAGGHAAGESGA